MSVPIISAVPRPLLIAPAPCLLHQILDIHFVNLVCCPARDPEIKAAMQWLESDSKAQVASLTFDRRLEDSGRNRQWHHRENRFHDLADPDGALRHVDKVEKGGLCRQFLARFFERFTV